MAITTYWDPFREATSLQRRLNSLFEDYNRQQGDSAAVSMGSFMPPVDIYEDEHKLSLKLEVPGIRQQDLDVQIENNTLTVRGERKFEQEEKEENFHRIERRYGSFTRSFTLPATVDTGSVKAAYENGVLRIDLGKRAEAKPRQIKVNVSGTNQTGASVQQTEKQIDATKPATQAA
jgi:HSP20 family protein